MDNQYRYVPSTMPYYKECILMWVLCGFLEIEYCTQFPGFTIAFWNLPWLCEIAIGLKMCFFPCVWTFIIVVSCWNKHNQWTHSNIPVPIPSGEYTKPYQTYPNLTMFDIAFLLPPLRAPRSRVLSLCQGRHGVASARNLQETRVVQPFSQGFHGGVHLNSELKMLKPILDTSGYSINDRNLSSHKQVEIVKAPRS